MTEVSARASGTAVPARAVIKGNLLRPLVAVWHGSPLVLHDQVGSGELSVQVCCTCRYYNRYIHVISVSGNQKTLKNFDHVRVVLLNSTCRLEPNDRSRFVIPTW